MCSESDIFRSRRFSGLLPTRDCAGRAGRAVADELASPRGQTELAGPGGTLLLREGRAG